MKKCLDLWYGVEFCTYSSFKMRYRRKQLVDWRGWEGKGRDVRGGRDEMGGKEKSGESGGCKIAINQHSVLLIQHELQRLGRNLHFLMKNRNYLILSKVRCSPGPCLEVLQLYYVSCGPFVLAEAQAMSCKKMRWHRLMANQRCRYPSSQLWDESDVMNHV